MRRPRALLPLVVAAAPACSFHGPAASGDGGPGDDAPPGGERGCDLAATWESGKSAARTIYVSKTPGAGTPDGSQANPFTTLAAAAASITAGTRIVLGPGDFGGVTLTDKQGTAEAPIWLEGPDQGPPARIVGSLGGGLHLIGAQYWVIRDLAIAGLTGQAGLNVDDGSGAGKAHHLVIERVNVGSSDRACVQLSGVTDVTLRDSVLGSCERGVMLVGVQRVTIGRVTIGGMMAAGVAMAGGSADIEVRQSVISSIPGGRGLWLGGDSQLSEFRPALTAPSGNVEATNIRVFDNVIRDVKDAIECSICTSSLVAHNLIRGVTRDVLNLYQPYTSLGAYGFARAGGVKLVNNAIEVASGAGAVSEGNGTLPATCSFSHNMWYRPGGAWDTALPSTEEQGIADKQSGYSDTGRLCGSAQSPAAGAALALPEVTGTLAGACRPAPPSIGPSEPASGC